MVVSDLSGFIDLNRKRWTTSAQPKAILEEFYFQFGDQSK
jgi:hypothetical protein